MKKHKTKIRIIIEVTQDERVSTYETVTKHISKLERTKELETTAKDAKSAFNIMYGEMKIEANELQQNYINSLIEEEEAKKISEEK